MKKYTKPEFNLYKFDIETSIMDATATPSPTPTMGVVYSDSGTSAHLSADIPKDVSTKVYTQYNDGNDWNWENK